MAGRSAPEKGLLAREPARRRWLARGLALLALALSLPGAPARAAPMEELPVSVLARAAKANVPLVLSSRGLELEVERQTSLVLPLKGAQELGIDYQSSGIVLLTYITVDPAARSLPDHRGPPYRYKRVAPGRGHLDLDLLETARWTRNGFPYLLLEGAGKFTITGLRYRPSGPDDASVRAAVDRAVFLSPVSIGFTTINLLYVPWWRITERTFLYNRLGWAFAVLVGLAVAGFLGLRRRLELLRSIALAALAVTALSDAVFLSKFLPATRPLLRLDPEERIRENYYYAPKLGALAALARATLRPGDRVGVRGLGADWFAPEVLCFDLAPRRCVTLAPGEREYLSPSRIDRLRLEDLDAIVSIDSDEPIPPGFVRVAGVSANAFIARRP